ncbi:MAG: hypothetical protein JZU65_23915 [Chlorobium sp.]|nr:hypothetical protein [Chlorobium sp.]
MPKTEPYTIDTIGDHPKAQTNAATQEELRAKNNVHLSPPSDSNYKRSDQATDQGASLY